MTTSHLGILALLVPLASCGLGVGEVSGGETFAEAQGALTGATTYVELSQGARGSCARVSMPTSASADSTAPSVAECCDDPQDTFDAARVEAVVELDLQQLPATSAGREQLGSHFVILMRTLETRRATRTTFPPLVVWLLHTLGRGAVTTEQMGDQRPPPPPRLPQDNGKTERWTVSYIPAGHCMVQKVTVVELCRVNASNQVSHCSVITTMMGPIEKVEPCSDWGRLLESRVVTYSVPGEWAGPAR